MNQTKHIGMVNITKNLKIPKHIAIIMDGNGKWSQQRLLPKIAGHRKGAEAARTIVKSCQELGVQYLTLYVFSTENWQRPAAEVNGVMDLLREYLKNDVEKLTRENVKIKFIGSRERLAPDILELMVKAETQTQDNEFHVILALGYGAREEIRTAALNFAQDVASGNIAAKEELFENYLFTKGIPDPDLLIRSGGECRISNYLLWQISYAELYFCDTLWPDFSEDDLITAITEYSHRERRYGARIYEEAV